MIKSVAIIIVVFVSIVKNIPLMRMRLCIASTDPYRLQSQCVLCHNRRFVLTVRQCTGGNYLPANVSVDEGYCMIKQCRMQMPLIPPQPYALAPTQVPSNEMSADLLYAGSGSEQEQPQYQYHQYQAPVKPMRIRPPALIHIGKPVRPGLLSGRPIIFGKRSVGPEKITYPSSDDPMGGLNANDSTIYIHTLR